LATTSIRWSGARRRGVPPVRLLLAALLAAGAVLASTGVVAAAAFSQPSAAKYALTVGAFVGAAVLLVVPRPALLLAALAVFVIPVSYLEATFGSTSLTLIALACGAAIAVRAVTHPVLWRPSPMAHVTVAALVLLAIPFIAGDGRRESAMALGAMLAVAWIVAATRHDPEGARVVAWAFVAAAVAQALVAGWEFSTGSQPNFYGGAGSRAFGDDYFFDYEGINRPAGTFFDPISLGNMLAVCLPFSMYLAARRGARPAERLLAVAAGMAIAAALVLTLSRMSWIGASAGLLVAALLMPRRMRVPTILALVVLATVGVSIGVTTAGPAVSERLESIVQPTSDLAPTSRGDLLRQQIYRDDVAVWKDHPVVGVGMGDLTPELVARTPELGDQGHAHSVYLGVLGQAGLLGAVAIVLVLLGALVAIWRGRARDPVLAATLAGAVVAMAVVWSTDYTIRYPSVAAVFGVVLGLVARQRPLATRPPGSPGR
jgi:hypothetical protein